MSLALRLASYNIRKAIGTDRRRSPNRILQVVAQLRADVVVLQEADFRRSDRPPALPRAGIEPVCGLAPLDLPGTKRKRRGDPSLGRHGNAILISPTISVLEVEPIDLPGLESRGAVRADLSLGDQPFRLVATHLGLLRRYRLRQLAALVRYLEALPALPTLVAGDFNEWSRRAGMEPLAPGFDVHSPGPSFHARHPIAPLDRIALGPGWTISESGVLDTRLARLASDHLPVWCDLSRT